MEGAVSVQERASLRSQCLSFSEVIGQSVANIAPSATPTFTIAIVFGLAGNGTWLAFLFATLAVLLVGIHINYFATRSASPGALYTFITEGAGNFPGFVSGSGLVLAYLLCACAVVPCYAKFFNSILAYVGVGAHIPVIVVAFVGMVIAWYVVYKDVKVSAKIMLTFEAVSLTLIMILGVIVFARSGFKPYLGLFMLKGVTVKNLGLGLVLAFFSFVGFESAAALGHEAKDPFRAIPRAVLISGAIVGAIFVVFSLLEVVGYMGTGQDLGQAATPLAFLAERNGVGWMGLLISFGAMISFWSCAVACITAAARVVLSMSKQRLMPKATAQVHSSNQTPYIAVTVISVISFVIPGILLFYKLAEMDIFAYLGSISTLGFLLSYIMIVIAAPIFLHKRKELRPAHIVVAVLSTIVLMIPMIGSVYPWPAYPFNLFPLIFLGWVVLSVMWYAVADSYRIGAIASDALVRRQEVASDAVAQPLHN